MSEQTETNWKYVSIAVAVALAVGGGILYYSFGIAIPEIQAHEAYIARQPLLITPTERDISDDIP